jgi:hypothetical protein
MEEKICNIIPIPTNEKTNIIRNINTGKFSYTLIEADTNIFKYQYLYIVSDDDIKQGDYIYKDSKVSRVITSRDLDRLKDIIKDYKKVIASTNSNINLPSIDKNFIPWWCAIYSTKTRIKIKYLYKKPWVDSNNNIRI